MNTKYPRQVDVAIVGGGPIGVEAAVALRQAGWDAQIMEAGSLGHTISWWAPHTRWFSSNDRIAIAGVPLHTVDQSKASREEYLTYLRGIVEQFDVPVHTFTKVLRIESLPTDVNGEDLPLRWKLGVTSHQPDLRQGARPSPQSSPVQQWVSARAVVLAIGGTDYPNRLGVPGEDLPHVDGYLRECHRYQQRRVLIVGGRNSAVEAAIRLHRVGAQVILSYHGEQLPETSIKYWLRPEIDGLIRSGSIQAFFSSRVTRIQPDCVELFIAGESPRSIPVDDVLTLIGYRQNSDLFQQLEIPLSGSAGAPEFDDETMQTCRPGVYLAGTAVGGTQSSRYQVFLENCHEHPQRIVAHLQSALANQDQPISVARSRHAESSLQSRIKWQPES